MKIPKTNYLSLYIVFISVILFLLIISQVFIQQTIDKHVNDAAIINYSGRQRMLSQNITKTVLVLDLKQNDVLPHEKDQLSILVSNFEDKHNYLLYPDKTIGLLPNSSKILEQLFERIQPHFEAIINNSRLFLKNISNKNRSSYVDKILSAEKQFLPAMDEIVFEYSRISHNGIENLKNIELLISVLIFLTILLEVILIIRPVLSKLSQNNKRLIISEIKLKESNAAKDKLFSIIAHDLRTPVNTLIGFSEILHEDFDDYEEEEIKNQLKVIHNSSQRVFKLLENLLDWSLIQTGSIKAQPELINLNKLIENNVELARGKAISKKINLSSDLKKDIYVRADLKMIDTVLRNLIFNALKFTNINGNITVSAKENCKVVETIVEDNGIGIKSASLNRLFKEDQICSTIGTAKESGTGLGLLLCKEFIEENGGKIFVESITGFGTKFKFTLPKADANQN